MAKETQKAKIERLEKELWDAKVLNSKLQQEILVFQENAEVEFLNSPSFTQMQRTIEQLNQEKKIIQDNLAATQNTNSQLRDEIQNLKIELEYQESDNRRTLEFAAQEIEDAKKGIKKTKNERGAGRKSLFTDEDKKQIHWYRATGKTIKEISELYCCSVGLIHKIINEKN